MIRFYLILLMSNNVKNDDIPTHVLPYEDLDEELRDLKEQVDMFIIMDPMTIRSHLFFMT